MTRRFATEDIAAFSLDRAPETTQSRGARTGLAAICLGFLMITLDATIVNVALGPIVRDLRGSIAAAQWVVNGYTLAFAALLLTAGALADRVGARTGYIIGLGVFALGSAICSAAVSLDMLIAARVLQGIGAAWLMPCSLALIAHMFPDTTQRRRALAVWAGLSGVGLASGPVLGGVLAGVIGWRAIFWVNLPVAAVALTLLVGQVQETLRHRHPLDAVGQLLAILTLSPLTAGFIVAGQRGWSDLLALVLLAGGIVAALLFVVAQRGTAHPMIDPVLFERRSFSLSVVIGLLFNFCLYGGLFCLAIGLGEGRGLSPLETGLALLPMTALVGTTAFLSGRVIARIGEWPAIAIGMSCGGLGAVLVATDTTHGSVVGLVLATIPLGFVSLAMAAMTATAMADVPSHRVGLASGVLNTARQAGGAFGVGVLGALLHAGHGVSLHAAFAGVTIAYGLGVTLAVIGLSERRVASAAAP